MAAVGVEQIAKALNVSPRRIYQLVNDGMPRAAAGQYELGQCMSWFIRYLQKALEARSTQGADGSITSLMSERTRQARAQAERMETANLKARGEVLAAEDVRQQVMRAIAYLAQDLTAIPQRVTSDETIQARIEDELRIARDAFADNLEKLAGPPLPAVPKPERSGKRRK